MQSSLTRFERGGLSVHGAQVVEIRLVDFEMHGTSSLRSDGALAVSPGPDNRLN